MFDRNGYCIIVDGYSTGKMIAPLLHQSPYSIQHCLHIKSSPNLPERFQHNAADFVTSLEYQGEELGQFIAEIQKTMGQNPIFCVIAGSETGIELADRLNAALGLPGNDATKSHLRRNKFLMNEAAKAAGMFTVEQCKANNIETIIEWAKTISPDQWPIVLKPLASQSADHVFFCHDEAAIRDAFTHIIQTQDLFNQPNDEVLAQSYNDGQEYIVNTVSCDGQHFPIEIWRIEKRPQTTIYEYAELLDPRTPEYAKLTEAVNQVLDTVGVHWGAGTTEFKYHPLKGPVLLETTSRPMAGAPVNFCQKLLGHHQVSKMLEAVLMPEQFLENISQLHTHQIAHAETLYGRIVVLISDTQGTLQEDISTCFSSLKTYFGQNFEGKTGTVLVETVDTLTTPGEIFLMGEKSQVLSDYEQIRALEQEGLYKYHVRTTSFTPSIEALLSASHSPLHTRTVNIVIPQPDSAPTNIASPT